MTFLKNHASFGTLNAELLNIELLNALKNTRNDLISLATNSDFVTQIKIAFGNNFDGQKVEELATSWFRGDFGSFPPIEIRDTAEINGANGAFSAATNTIYLSREFVRKNEGNGDAIAAVLLEEYGHYIDSQINAIDTPGDEGEIFAAIVQKKQLTQPEILALQAEDDEVTVILDSREIAIEQNTSQFDRLDFFVKDIELGKENIDWKDESLLTSVNAPFNFSVPLGLLNLVELEGNLQSSFGLVPYGKTASAGRASFKYPVLINVSRNSQDIGNNDEFSLATTYNFALPSLEGPGFNFADAGVELRYGIGPINFNKLKIGNTPFGSILQQDISTSFEGFPNQSVKFPVGFQQEFGKLLKFEIDTSEVKALQLQNQGNPLKIYEFGSTMEGKGEASFVKLEGDVDAAVAELIPAYRILNEGIIKKLNASPLPFGGELTGLGFNLKVPKPGPNGELPRAFVDLGLDIANLTANLELDLEQTFTFKAENVSVSVSVDKGSVVGSSEGNLGTEFKFQSPTSGSGIMTVTSKYKLLGEVENKLDLISKGSLKLEVAKAELAFKFPLPFDSNSQFTNKGKFGPLFEKILPENGLTIINKPLVGLPGSGASIAEIPAAKLNELPGEEDATKNLEIEKKYYIPYNMPYSFTASSFSANERDGSQTFSVQRNGDTSEEETVTIAYGFTGDSANSSDYSVGETTVTFQPGETTASFEVSIVDDTEQESSETYTVYLKDSSGNSFPDTLPNGKPTISTTGVIIDDDQKPQPPEKQGTTWGDPHLITLDGVIYDFQSVGEFTLLKSTSGDLEIQTRQQPLRNTPLSVNTAIATKVEGRRVVFYRRQDRSQPLWIDGNPVEIPDLEFISFGNSRIYREGDTYTLVYPNGEQLVVDTYIGGLDINIYLGKEREEQVVGLLGNNNGKKDDEITLRDGTVLKTPIATQDLYAKYANSWRISQAESLFDYQPGEDTNTFTDPNFPVRSISINDIDPVQRQKAEQIARAAGITNPKILEAAIIDLVFSDFDESFLPGALQARIPEESLILAIPAKAVDDFAATKVNIPVKINVLSNDEGTIGVPLAIANFDSTTAKGGTISIYDNGTPDNKNDDRLIYTPPANFTDIDTFNYTVSDGKDSSTAKVTVSVNAPFPPSAAEDFSSTEVNTPVKIDVLSNDISLENLPLIIANFDQTSIAGSIIKLDDNGTPDDKTDDQLIYTPTANFTGNDTFNYTVTDGAQTSTVKVTVNIAAFNLSNLNGSNGFTLNGIIPGNFAGVSVNTLKDFNGDGFHDFIIGAFGADPNNNNAAGETYVVFGKQGGFPTSIDLPKLDGSNGFILNGIDTNGFSGGSVSSAGDINGDGLDDLVIGAFGATANGQNNAGKSYILFGSKAVFPARLNLSDLNGNNGFVVNGINEFDYLGLAVSGAGDINADGIDDLLIGAPGSLNGTTNKSYIIYGHEGTFAANLNSSDINGSNGFAIDDNDGKSGTSVSAAGDINGDGIDDIIINAEENDSNNYIIFGSANGFAANFNLAELNGSNGFILDTGNDKSGTTVSKAGDINGDTIDDLIVSLASSDSNLGKSYILFGSNRGFAPRFDVSQLNGTNGFALINNIDGNSINAVSSAGDINGDGIDDLAISTSQANANAGKTYILFGDNAGFTPSFYLSKINGNNGFIINGVKEDDLSGTSLSQGGDINGDNIDDLVIGSPGNLFNNSPGQTHVVFGSTLFGSSKDPSNLAKLLFDSRYYLNQNPDVRSAVADGFFHNGFEHFVKFGLTEGREPSATFAGDYLTNNPDVAAAVNTDFFQSGFEHFIKAGFAEGRQPDFTIGSLAALEVFYRSENPDVVQAIQQGIFSSGLEHLIRFGMLEGRSPFTRFNALSETFDADFYLAENPDVKQAVDSGIFRSALEHFVNLGLFEGRNPSSQFSNSAYLANHPDVAGAVSNGFFRSGYEHFIKLGFGEERVGVALGFE